MSMDTEKITFDRPAGWKVFTESLPIGNGRLGAVTYGDPQGERIQFNEESLWYGGPMNRVNPGALEVLPEIRSLIRQGRIPEAERLMRYHLAGIPQSMRPYQPLCEMNLQFQIGDGKGYSDYRQELCLNEALVRTTYCASDSLGKIRCEWEYFASAPDDCMVFHYKAGEPGQGALSFDALLTRERFYTSVKKISDDTILLYGRSGENGVYYAAALRAQAFRAGTDDASSVESASMKAGGDAVLEKPASVQVLGENLVIENADEAVLLLTAGTTYRYVKDELLTEPAVSAVPRHLSPEIAAREAQMLEQELTAQLDHAQQLGYAALKKRHIEDYQALYNRCALKLPPENSQIERYWNYGRFLLISCSREGGLPAALQGLWNNEFLPPWDAKYTININTQMNYWPAEMLGLGDCHLPLFTLLRMITVSGQQTARRMYGCRGAVVHHNTDLWADTAPQDVWIPGTFWVMAGAWLCTHIWQHYKYTHDRAWLAGVYDLLEQHALFYTDFVTVTKDGVELSPSVSPENTYILEDGTQGRICANSTIDLTILKEFLQDYLAAAEVLGTGDPEIMSRAQKILDLLPPLRIGKYGQIMEWEQDYAEAEPGHRHISQLYGLFPGREISPRKTPELAEAALATIRRRLTYGGGHTGWSCAWLIALYARLGEAQLAEDMLHKLLAESTAPNLMDTHPLGAGAVFQIDGNLGACAAITLMLVQEEDGPGEDGKVILLPACPADWTEGELTGVRLKGNAVLSFRWKNGRVTQMSVSQTRDTRSRAYHRDFIVNGKIVPVSLQGTEETCTFDIEE
ncbi:MAG: glycoside hydrolase family 95 protein [Lachnospiraceae bacterium]|nr:glycoside hydrolase family 95 protein [Lachnospiraceae bacterium]